MGGSKKIVRIDKAIISNIWGIIFISMLYKSCPPIILISYKEPNDLSDPFIIILILREGCGS